MPLWKELENVVKNYWVGTYQQMMNKIEPDAVICFGTPFDEKNGNIVSIYYRSSRKVVR